MIVVASLTGVSAAVLWRSVLPRLAEPVTDEAKRPYASLAGWRETLLVAVVGAAAGAYAALLAPTGTMPQWLVLATVGVCLAAVDGLTTWIPARPARWAWLVMAGGITTASALPDVTWRDLTRSLAGAAAYGAFYFVAWLITRRGFGFGDVRFVPLIGAATAAVSWTTWYAGLACGCLLALAHALVRMVRRAPGLHPWAPGLLLGGFAALLLNR